MNRRNFFGFIGSISALAVLVPTLAFRDEPLTSEVLDKKLRRLIDTEQYQNIIVRLMQKAPDGIGFVEANYKGYNRVRTGTSDAYWTVTDKKAVNACSLSFGTCKGGENIISAFNLTDEKGNVLYRGLINQPLEVVKGITPIFEVGQLEITTD